MPEAREGEANFESAQGSHRTPSAFAVSEAGGWGRVGPRGAVAPFGGKCSKLIDSPEIFPSCHAGKI